jgi:glycyl-tRNA synthetase beta subunit
MSVDSIRTKLVLKLNEMQSLKTAFDYEASNSEGKYPFATVTLRAGESEFASTASNLRRRQFRIHVFQERTKAGQGSEAAEDIATDVIDELEVAMDMDTTLSGTCKYVRPVRWTAGYVDRELDTRILEVTVEAVELVSSL